MLLKKNVIVVLLAGLLAFGSVFLFYRIQERDYLFQLDNHNLSADAFKFTLKNNESLYQLNQQVKASPSLNDVQLHYQDKNNKNITYFFGKGDFATPPMISGNFFSKNDFETKVTVAVVGKNVAKKLYQPKDQAYLLLNGQYIPVLGVMGDKQASALDNQIFISASSENLMKLNTANYKLRLDGYAPISKKEMLTSLNLASLTKLVSQKLILSKDAWINLHYQQILGLLVIIIAFIIGAILWNFSLHQAFYQALFLQKNPKKFIFEAWERYCLFNGIGIILGVLVGCLWFSLNSYMALFIFNGCVFIGVSLFFLILLNLRTKKEIR